MTAATTAAGTVVAERAVAVTAAALTARQRRIPVRRYFADLSRTEISAQIELTHLHAAVVHCVCRNRDLDRTATTKTAAASSTPPKVGAPA